MNEYLEVIWSRVNDTFAVDFYGNGCNHVGNKKITKSSKKSRVASELPLDRTRSSLLLINLIYTKNLIYRLGEAFVPIPLKTQQNSSLNPTRRFKTLKNA